MSAIRSCSCAPMAFFRFRAKGSIPVSRSRSRLSRRAARTWSPREAPGSGIGSALIRGVRSPTVLDHGPLGASFPLELPRVAVEDQAQPLEGEPRLVVVDLRAERRDEPGPSSGGDDGGVASQLLLDPLDDPLDLRGFAEYQAGLHGVDRAPAD